MAVSQGFVYLKTLMAVGLWRLLFTKGCHLVLILFWIAGGNFGEEILESEHSEKKMNTTINGVHDSALQELIDRMDGRVERIEADLEPRRHEDRLKYRKRFGIRTKKNFPFPNAANYSLRLADKIIRKLKPHYLALVAGLGGDKAEVLKTPGCSDDVWQKTRNVINYILNFGIPDYEPLMWVAIDKAMMYDFAIVSPYWLRRTKLKKHTFAVADLVRAAGFKDVAGVNADAARNGQEPPFGLDDIAQLLAVSLDQLGFTFDLDDSADKARLFCAAQSVLSGQPEFDIDVETVVENRNAIRVIDPADFVVDRSVKHIQSADLICERMYFTPEQFRVEVASGRFDRANALEVLSSLNSASSSSAQGERAGMIKVNKVCCVLPEGDFGGSRAVVYYCPDYKNLALSFARLDGEKWPYVQLKIEFTDEGFYSPRGVVSLIDTFDRVINAQFNNMMNRRLITSTPMLTHVPTKVYPSNIRYIPGQSIPVKEQGAIKPLVLGANSDVVFEKGILFVRAWAENFMGVPDYAMKSSRGSRTASEVNLIAGLKDVLVEMDARVFNQSLEELFELLYLDWLKHADSELEYSIDGSTVKFDRSDISPNPKFKAVATFTKVNRGLQMERAQRRLALFSSDPFIDQYELRRQALIFEGDGLAEKLLLDPEQAATNVAAIKTRRK